MRAETIVSAGSWNAAAEVDRVRLDFDHRSRRRIVLRTEGGRDLLLDLAAPARLREGDGLLVEGGGVVRVIAEAEPLAEIAAGHDALVRIAWHLGNRHLPVQLLPGRIRLRADHVIEEMAAGLGGTVTHVAAPFDPESGAYAGGGAHHHAHD